MFDPGLARGDTVDNVNLRKIFGCSGQGGMRRSKKTNTLVIVSDHPRGLYEDRWDGEVLHYTGMGQRGEQTLKGNQNRTLAEAED